MDSRLRGKDGGISVHDDSIGGLWPSSPRTRGPTRSVLTLNVFPCIKSQADSMDSRLRGKDGGRSDSNFSNEPYYHADW